MKNKLIYIWFVVAVLLFGSCSKFLEERSQSEIIPKTTTDFSDLLLGTGYQGATDPMSFLLLMTDEYEFFYEYATGTPAEYANVVTSKDDFPYYSWQPYCQDYNGQNEAINTSPASGPYFAYYTWIMGCNAILDYIDNAIGTQAERDRIKAEALANRAFHYFRLVNIYGAPYNHPDFPEGSALGVPLKLESDMTLEALKQNTVAEVYAQVVSDLKEAIALATPLPEVRGDFRINVTTMHIILSRVYLYMEKWSDVVAHADTAFQRGIQYLDLTTYPSYVAGTTPPSYLRYENSSEVQWVYGQIANLPSHYNPSIEVRTMLAGVKDARCVVGFSISKEENTVNKVFQSKVTGGGTNALNQAIRTAEACLNRAEAKIMRNQGNDLAEAENDLNDLRKNRIFAPYTEIHGLSQAELIDFIKAERFLEFFGEHFRWFDLRRWGMPEIKHRYKHSLNEDVVTYTLNKKDPMYTLPFPSSLGLNNLSLVQNPSRAMPDRIPEY